MTTSANLICLCCLLFPAAPILAANSAYKAVELYALTYGATAYFVVNDISDGKAVGNTVDSAPHALYWSNPNNGAVSLQPTNLDGINVTFAFAVAGEQQVGRGHGNDSIHALIWNGSGSSTVDLHPTNLSNYDYSEAYGTNGSQQVGIAHSLNHGEYHAMLWNGSPDSAVDLHPTLLGDLFHSVAFGTNGAHQVGNASGVATNHNSHAMLWNGTAESAIDLHPAHLTGIVHSKAASVNGGQQVGSGWDSYTHAVLWHGTAESAVDLHPTQFSQYTESVANETNGAQQVGRASHFSSASDYYFHAMLWHGTADSAVNLHALLPPGFTWSEAYSIDQEGIVYGIGYDAQGPHAIMWVPVPEPTSVLLAIFGALIPAACYRNRHSWVNLSKF